MSAINWNVLRGGVSYVPRRIAIITIALGSLSASCHAESSEKLVETFSAVKTDSPTAKEVANIGYCIGYIMGR